MRYVGGVACFSVVLALAVPAADATFRAAARTPPGTLDASRAGGGKVITDIRPNAVEFTAAAAQTPDDKIVVAGTVDNGAPTGFDMTVVRYNRDGTVDTSFSGDGIASVDFGGPEFAADVAVQRDGKIVVFGAGTGFILARFNTDGSLDSSFDGDGKVVTNFSGPAGINGGMAITSDGKIAVAGTVATGPNITNFDFAFARYTGDGSLDSSFSGDGTFVFGISPGAANDAARDLAIQRDGKLVAAGVAVVNAADFAVVRLNGDGTPDSSFDGDGAATVPVAPGQNTDSALAVALQPDGKIVAAGGARMGANNTNLDSATVRLNGNGSLDTSFGGDGIVTHAVAPGTNNDFATGIVVKPSLVRPRGRAFRAAGVISDHFRLIETGDDDDESGDEDCWIDEMDPDGDLDDDFAGGGIIRSVFGIDVPDECADLILYNPKIGGRLIVNVGAASAEATFLVGLLLADPQTSVCIAIRCRFFLGTGGNDLIVGTNGPDQVEALSGNDLIRTLNGPDSIMSGGGPGNDAIYGGGGNDRMDGAAGNDRLFGQGGNDLLLGGKGNDLLNGGSGRDRCAQGPGKGRRVACERR